MPQVFISYSSKDKSTASRIARDLAERDVNVWFDEWNINVGDSLIKTISKGLEDSNYLLVLLSENSSTSDWVTKEISLAFERDPYSARTVIIPVLLEKMNYAQIPFSLRDRKWVDLSKGYEKGVEEIAKAVQHPPKTSGKLPSQLLDVDDLAREVAKEVAVMLRTSSSGIRLSAPRTKKRDPSLVFVIMSFSTDMDPIFEGMKAAGEKFDLKVERVRDVPGDYRITDKIIEMINAARFIIADLTHERPNVYFELGYARGLGKTVITTAREGTKLHFDVKDWTCHFYNDSRVVEERLTERFAYELGRHQQG